VFIPISIFFGGPGEAPVVARGGGFGRGNYAPKELVPLPFALHNHLTMKHKEYGDGIDHYPDL
jgi:hypothetical protein